MRSRSSSTLSEPQSWVSYPRRLLQVWLNINTRTKKVPAIRPDNFIVQVVDQSRNPSAKFIRRRRLRNGLKRGPIGQALR